MLRSLLLTVLILTLFVAFGLGQGGSSTATDTSSSAKPATARFTPTKEQIKAGQEVLIKEKFWTGEATGVYGESRPAIKAYQKANGLEQTGNFNQATLEKMKIALTDKQKGGAAGVIAPIDSTAGNSPTDSKAGKTGVLTPTDSKVGTTGAVTPLDSSAIKRPAPFRANDDQIKAAQKILRDGKMLTGGEDGKLDDLTREALGKYQEANGLRVMKSLNAATLEKMGIALTDKQKEQVAAQAAYDAAKTASKDQ